MPISREELERDFREQLERHRCVSCHEPITGAALDWGYAQPSEYARGGPFRLKCERCGAVQEYDVFRRKLTLAR